MSAATVEQVNALKRARAAVRSARSVAEKAYDRNDPEGARSMHLLFEQLLANIDGRFKTARARLSAPELEQRAHGAGGGHQ